MEARDFSHVRVHEPVLETISELWLTEQEKKLGLPIGECCTSSSWWAGFEGETEDHLITDEYDFLVPLAIAEHGLQQDLRKELDALYELDVDIDVLKNLVYKTEELLEKSQLCAVGNKDIEYIGYFCEVILVKNNTVYLQDRNSDLHFGLPATKFFAEAQLALPAEEKEKTSLSDQIQSASARVAKTTVSNEANSKESELEL